MIWLLEVLPEYYFGPNSILQPNTTQPNTTSGANTTWLPITTWAYYNLDQL